MGLGSLCLAVVLAQTRVPFNGGCLPVLEGSRRGGGSGRRGEFSRHGREVAPARRSGGTGDTADVTETHFYLFPCAAGYLWLEGSEGSLIPLAGPSARHQGGLIGDIE